MTDPKDYFFKITDQIGPVEYRRVCILGERSTMKQFVERDDFDDVCARLRDARTVNDTLIQSYFECFAGRTPTRAKSRDAMIKLIEWALTKISMLRPADQPIVESIYSKLPQLRGEA